MRNLLVMGATGAGLFCVTVVGLLAAQGRLNHEGTKGIPVLGALFPATPEVAPAARTHTAASRQVGAERPPVTVREPARRGGREATSGTAPQGGDRYRAPGELFALRPIEARLSADEINAAVQRARTMQEQVEAERAELAQRRRDLDAQQQDVAERQARVERLLAEVEAERAKVERAIADFNERVKVIKADELQGLRVIAGTIASLSPEAAKDLILDYWRTPEGRDRAVRILTVMDPDRVNALVAEMDTARMREVLERRSTYVRERPAKQRGTPR